MFNLKKSIQVLERTPEVLSFLLLGLSKNWTHSNEGENTWSPYYIVGHFIIGEQSDWMVRAKIILSDSENKTFEPFDRFAQFNLDQNKSIAELLDKFKTLRQENLKELKSRNLTAEDFIKTGIHPEFGTVTLQQLLSTWVVHDLSHLAQIARVMAKQYKEEIGPWKNYIPLVKERTSL